MWRQQTVNKLKERGFSEMGPALKEVGPGFWIKSQIAFLHLAFSIHGSKWINSRRIVYAGGQNTVASSFQGCIQMDPPSFCLAFLLLFPGVSSLGC